MPSFCWPLALGPNSSMTRPRTGQRNAGAASATGLLEPESAGPSGAGVMTFALLPVFAPVPEPRPEDDAATCCLAGASGFGATADGEGTAGTPVGVVCAAASFAGLP